MDSGLIELLAPLHGDSFGWALACCNWQQDMAEDILQESYLRVTDGRARFAGRSTLQTWFFGVIRRVALEQRRRHRRTSTLSLRLLQENESSIEEPVDASAIYTEEIANQLRIALAELPARQREVLHLVFYSDLTLEEAAQTLQISVGSARTHYHRAKRRMAELLGGLDYDK